MTKSVGDEESRYIEDLVLQQLLHLQAAGTGFRTVISDLLRVPAILLT